MAAQATRDPHETPYFHFGKDRALRQGPWKLVSAKSGRWEMYRIDLDRSETNDLAAEHPGRVAKMSREWFRIAKEVDRLPCLGLQAVRKDLTKLNFRKPRVAASRSSSQ